MEGAGSIPSLVCRPSFSEFSVVFSEIRKNTDPLERPHRGHSTRKPRSHMRTVGLNPTTTTTTIANARALKPLMTSFPKLEHFDFVEID